MSVTPQHGSGVDTCLAGRALYGDDFTPEQIAAWYADEAEGYANLGAADRTRYRYHYHALNDFHGFGRLPRDQSFGRVLGFGSAYGDELAPIAPRAGRITIVDPSDAFADTTIRGVPTDYVRPAPSGELPFDAATFDLATSLGVLHHIPNVSFVLRELARCLRPGGYLLLREPVVSMGDWRRPRRGLTARERGIPLHLLGDALARAGFETVREAPCIFASLNKLIHDPYSRPGAVRLDALLCRLMRRNLTYHATGLVRKVRPTNHFFVLRRA